MALRKRLDRDIEPRGNFTLQLRDLDILRQYARYRFLTLDLLHLLVGGNKIALRKRICDLKHQGFLIRTEAQYRYAGWLARSRVHEISDAGRKLLEQSGIEEHMVSFVFRGAHALNNLLHSLYLISILVGIEVGAKEQGCRLIPWTEILAKAPDKTRKLSHPHKLPAGKKQTIIPDAIFGILYPQGAKFYALEADMGTEPIERSHMRTSSFLRKVKQYREVIENRTFASHLGLKYLQVLTVTKRENINGMLNLLEKGNNYMLFLSATTPPKDIFTTTWIKKDGEAWIKS